MLGGHGTSPPASAWSLRAKFVQTALHGDNAGAGWGVSPEVRFTQAQMHEALACLNDNVRLAQTELARLLPQLEAIVQLDERAQWLRALLLEAIEALSPPRPARFRSLEGRLYDVLTLRYVERLSTIDMAEELGISRRQVHRDLRLAEEKLAELMTSWARSASAGLMEQPSMQDPLSEELSLFCARAGEVVLGEVLAEAERLVQPLMAELRASVLLPAEAELAHVVMANRAFLRQLLVQLLSVAVQAASPGEVRLRTSVGQEGVALLVELRAARPSELSARLEELARIASSQGFRAEVRLADEGQALVQLVLPLRRPVRVLVVEDNPGAVELYRRYLPTGQWQVEAISDPRIACEVARALKPHIIILDIMMPYVDGWSLLDMLKEDESLRRIPVVVCSVINDPALGRALGAKAYLNKPISQGRLIMALQNLLSQQRAP